MLYTITRPIDTLRNSLRIMHNQNVPYILEFRHMEPGIVGYDDIGVGLVAVPPQTITSMRSSLIGKPIYYAETLDHPPEEYTGEQMLEWLTTSDGPEDPNTPRPSGIVVSAFSYENNDYAIAEIYNIEAIDYLKSVTGLGRSGGYVSNGYRILDMIVEPNEDYNNVSVDLIVTAAEYDHVAIVDEFRRYTNADVVDIYDPRSEYA